MRTNIRLVKSVVLSGWTTTGGHQPARNRKEMRRDRKVGKHVYRGNRHLNDTRAVTTDRACQPGHESPAPQRLLTPHQSASQNECNDKVPRAVVAWRFPKTSTVLLASNAVSCRMLLESATYGGYDSDRSAATST